MNKKGFTLIELIATIVLLGIIASISFVSINAVIKKNKENNCNTIKNNIKTAANEYASDNRYNTNFTSGINNNIKHITGSDLISNNYLSNSDDSIKNIEIYIYFNNDYTVKSVSINNPEALEACVSSNPDPTPDPTPRWENNACITLISNATQSLGGYRYVGSNPNNYVSFNNETWRIIGMFNVKKSANGPEECRVKIMRNTAIRDSYRDTFSWNNGLYGECYNAAVTGESIPSCSAENPINKLLNTTSKKLIDDALWYTGLLPMQYGITVSNAYYAERSHLSASPIGWNDTWVGKMALMYVTDYALAASDCDVNLPLVVNNADDISACDSRNWMHSVLAEIQHHPTYSNTITSFKRTTDGNKSAGSMISIDKVGKSNICGGVGYTNNVDTMDFPVVYLKHDAIVISGDGTQSNPYVFSLNNN